ncbi:MAG: hypothetical protein WBB50_10665 [Methyloceanibacter sp.]
MSQRSLTLFRPSLILVPLGVAALAAALFLRTGIVENTPIGLSREQGAGDDLRHAGRGLGRLAKHATMAKAAPGPESRATSCLS